jgi:hypothetical protein
MFDGIYREKTVIKKIKNLEATLEAKKYLYMIDAYED